MVEEFVAERSKQDGRANGAIISAASINLDLRNIRAALNKAVDWDYLAKAPKITFEREYFKEPRVIEPEHFAAMFEACETARMPAKVAGITPGEWWHALLALLVMAGWRIGEALRLKRGDVDLEKRTALTRAEDNKGKRDFRTPLHPVIVDWMMPLFVSSAGEQVFPWLGIHNTRTLYLEFGRLQVDAWVIHYKKLGNIEPPLDEAGKIVPAWPLYGFHDFRRTFATANADNLTDDMLQQLMRHRSPMTTARYKHSTKQRRLASATDALIAPDVLKPSAEVET
jgi:integrase